MHNLLNDMRLIWQVTRQTCALPFLYARLGLLQRLSCDAPFPMLVTSNVGSVPFLTFLFLNGQKQLERDWISYYAHRTNKTLTRKQVVESPCKEISAKSSWNVKGLGQNFYNLDSLSDEYTVWNTGVTIQLYQAVILKLNLPVFDRLH